MEKELNNIYKELKSITKELQHLNKILECNNIEGVSAEEFMKEFSQSMKQILREQSA